jgi:putative serine protease PepD
VIGINDQIESDTNDNAGVGFAVPINAAKDVAQTLIAGGKVQHAYLGVTINSVANGARVACVVKSGPADSAGLKVGDVITKFNSKSISAADALTTAVIDAKPNQKATLTVVRGGSSKQVAVTLGTQPSSLSNNCTQ